MSISQQDIADRLGVDRTSVTKILNRTPGHMASPKTVELVFKTAREMGYDFSRLKHTHGRRYDRKPVELGCELEILLEDKTTYDRGRGTIRNVSMFGALITDLIFPRNSLPLSPFTVVVKALDGEISGVQFECEVIRLRSYQFIDLGLNILHIEEADRQVLEKYVG